MSWLKYFKKVYRKQKFFQIENKERNEVIENLLINLVDLGETYIASEYFSKLKYLHATWMVSMSLALKTRDKQYSEVVRESEKKIHRRFSKSRLRPVYAYYSQFFWNRFNGVNERSLEVYLDEILKIEDGDIRDRCLYLLVEFYIYVKEYKLAEDVVKNYVDSFRIKIELYKRLGIVKNEMGYLAVIAVILSKVDFQNSPEFSIFDEMPIADKYSPRDFFNELIQANLFDFAWKTIQLFKDGQEKILCERIEDAFINGPSSNGHKKIIEAAELCGTDDPKDLSQKYPDFYLSHVKYLLDSGEIRLAKKCAYWITDWRYEGSALNLIINHLHRKR